MERTDKVKKTLPVGKKAVKAKKAGKIGTLLAASDTPLQKDRIRRGTGEIVALTVRLPKDAWMKLRQFAMSQGETIQTLAVSGFNRELAAKGEPPLDV
jgi:hypothetical protein